MRHHEHGTATFTELPFPEQGKSISEQSVVLERAIRHHVTNSWQPAKTHEKCLNQVRRLLTRLEEIRSVRGGDE